MHRLVKIPCATCGTMFLPKSYKNLYCKRSCFKKHFYHKKKEEDLKKKKFPSFKCPNCKKMIDLNFDPLIDDIKWTHFECPFCRTLMINVFENVFTEDIKT